MAKKLYYKIGEACKLLDIQPYVLRYWETEFPALTPRKSKSGQRTYDERDLALIRRIKTLLYDEGYTIAGAKKQLDDLDLEALEASVEKPAAKEKKAEKPKAKAGSAEEDEPKDKANPKSEAKAASRDAGGKSAEATTPAKKPATKKKAPKKARAATSSADADRLAALEKGLRKALKEARSLQAMLERKLGDTG